MRDPDADWPVQSAHISRRAHQLHYSAFSSDTEDCVAHGWIFGRRGERHYTFSFFPDLFMRICAAVTELQLEGGNAWQLMQLTNN